VTDIITEVDPGTGDNTDPKEKCGRWLGHAIDIGPAVTANIWRTMGKFFTVQEHMRLRNSFIVSIVEKIGKFTMTEDLADLDQDAETPKNEVYQAELEGMDMSLMLMLVQMQLHLKI